MTVQDWTAQKHHMDAETPEDAHSEYRCQECGRPVAVQYIEPSNGWPYGAVVCRCAVCNRASITALTIDGYEDD